MLDFSVTFFITIINIAFLFFILRKILFKPVTKFMADRAKRIRDSIDEAEQEKAQARKLREQYEARQQRAKDEAEAFILTARKSAKQEAERYITEAKAEAAEIIAGTRLQLELEKKAAMDKFISEAANLITVASSRLVARELTNEDNEHYADMLIKELARQKGNN